MVLVEGSYCPKVEQQCLRYLDAKAGRFGEFRCAEYAPSRCVSAERRSMRYCIDRDEHTRQGESLPDNHASLRIAEKTAASHVEHIMTKLDLRTRAQLAIWAVQHGLAGEHPA